MKDIYKRHFLLFSVAAFTLLVLFALPLYADSSIAPDKVKVNTPVYRPNFADFDPKLGTYEYRVSWQGIGAARLWVNVEKQGLQYRLSTVAKTNSFVDVFYKLRYTAVGHISAIDLLPLKTVVDHVENSREKKTELEFLPSGDIHSVHWRKGRGITELKFNPDNFTLDPFSASFLARSLDWELGQERKFDTFNGKTRYLITLKAKEKTKIKVNGVDRPVWVVSPTVKKLTEKNPKQKLRQARIYVTADSARDILKIDSEVFVGSVITELVGFTPSGQPLPGTHMAKSDQRRIVLQ